MAQDRGLQAAGREQAPAQLKVLAKLVNGCKDNLEGKSAKTSIVMSFISSSGEDPLGVLCWLHTEKAVTVDIVELLRRVEYRKPPTAGSPALSQASNPGMFVASALDVCTVADMPAIVDRFISCNSQTDVIDMLRYVSSCGFMKVDAAVLMSMPVANWKKPLEAGKEPPNWMNIWEGPLLPIGSPTYVNVRDFRGRKAQVAFLGTVEDTGIKPADILVEQWKLPTPTMCIIADAGSTHPLHADLTSRMCNLPQFHEWVAKAAPLRSGLDVAAPAAEPVALPPPKVSAGVDEVHGSDPAPDPALSTGPPMRRGWDTIRNHHVSKRKIVSVQDLLRTSIDVWQKELPEVDTDELLADGSINKLIYTRLQEVFGAFLDAAAVAGSWIVVDRTCGQGSATAELLIEQALERGAQRPIILAIDSLERLGKARDGSRSHGIIKQLNRMFVDDEAASQNPNGTEKVLDINFAYSLHDFDAASEYNVAESRLPFDVADDHKADAQGGVACDPMRKWSYFYSDALFASASYYVLKNDDRDEFDIESFAKLGFVYANGDTCTYRRLRRDVQQGKPMVLLHNSGGVVTAFSWLQRVMAFARPVPSLDELRGPLKFLVANLSRDAWIEQLGTPEMSIMKGLADRAPQLFMKRIVSVDILTDSEESTLELMTACFASASAVSELGLGHADVNVIFNAWNLHLTLCENAVRFRAKFVKAQLLLWALAVMTACVAISAASLGDAGDTDGALLQRALMLNASSTAEITTWMDRTVVLLPIFSALVGAIAAKQSWQDKWSVSVMAATYLAFEIYKFRTSTFEYDPSRPTPSVLGRHKVALKTKDTAQNARQVFVSRVQEFYGACVNEIARGGALQRKQAKVSAASVQDLRAAQESRPTFAEWYKLKLHVEDHSYRTAWTLPRGNLAKWSSGLTPYLQQPTLREDLRTVVENLVGTNRVTLKGVALSDADSKRVRQGLAATLGLAKNALEVHADEIRELQREVAKVLGKQQASQDDEAPDTVEGTQAGPGNANLRATTKGGSPSGSASAPLSAREGDHPLGNSAADGKVVADAAMAMRKVIADLQGLPFGPITAAERREAKVNNTKQTAEGKGGEDDYLLDPLSIDNYVMFRLRPVVDRWEHEVWMLSRRLHAIDAMSFVISTIGVVLATGVVNALEWVPITVLLVVLLTAAAEFTQLRNRVAQMNSSLADLQKIVVRWESLSVLQRRSNAVKARLVGATERAILEVVSKGTTAASNTQTSIEQTLGSNNAVD